MGSMLGGGGGKDGGGTRGQDQLSNLVSGLSAETTPIRQTLTNQFLEALNTGGVGASIPIITAAQEQSQQGTARALQGTTNDLTRMRLAGTPFGASVLAGQRMAGEQQTSLIPSQVAQAFVSGAPSYAMAPVGAMIGGAGTLGGIQASRDIAKGQQQTDLFKGLMSVAGAAAGGAMMCWVARALYGDSREFYAARWWLLYAWRGRTADVVRWLYRRYGQRVAAWRGVGVLRPPFNMAVRRGSRQV